MYSVIFLPLNKSIPQWVYDHPMSSDKEILELHAKVFKEEQDLWMTYHLEMSLAPTHDEIRSSIYTQYNRLKKMRQAVIDTLKQEMDAYRFMTTRTDEIVYRTDHDLVHAHARLLIANRVSAKAIHLFLVQWRLSMHMEEIEKELDQYQGIDMTSVTRLYEEIQTLKLVRESIEKWIGGTPHAELASLVSLHFK